MKKSIDITPNIETLFGTRDENHDDAGQNELHPAIERPEQALVERHDPGADVAVGVGVRSLEASEDGLNLGARGIPADVVSHPSHHVL